MFVPRRRAAIIVVSLGVPFLAVVLGSRLLTDYLWFREVGHAGVFWRVLGWKAGVLAGVGGAVAVCLLATLRTALRRAPSKVPRAPVFAGAATCIVLGCAVGLYAMGRWQIVMLWMHRSEFGVLDPVHHRDVGFFVFTLPLLDASANIALAVVVIAGALAAAVYALFGALSVAPLRATAAAGTHLAVLAAFALAAFAGRLILMTYSMEISRAASSGRAFPGADYVDVRVRIPALQLLALLTLLCAGAVVAGAWLAANGYPRAGARVAGWPLLATACVALTSLLLVPWVVQKLVVDPQPVARERPMLRGALDATQHAFSLADVEVSQERPRTRIPASVVARDLAVLANVQVWDSSVLIDRMRQLASGTPYFRVHSPTLDVEHVNGKERLMVFAEQELDLRQLSGPARGWGNSHFVYTHGLGSFRFSASRIGSDGMARRPLPAPSSQPRIYFGRQAPGAAAWVVVNTRRSEADRPIPAQQPQKPYHYDGSGGIALSSWIRRTEFAIRLRDPALLLSHDITSRSRIILQRDVISRLTTLAGFLRWDPATSAIEADGRITFLADGYTTSSSYPQAEPVRLAGGWVNYARASVLATVDAFSGDTHLYLYANGDPVARAWAAAFPGLFQPISELPSELRAQLRYPPALFDAQAELYQRFHARSPGAFASGADDWGRPASLSGSIGVAGNIRFGSVGHEPRHELRPAYRLAVPPRSQGRTRLLRTTLYSPRGGENVVAEFDGWIDDHARPRLSLVTFPGHRVIRGPSQISQLAFTTPRVTNALKAINKETTDVSQHSLTSVTLGTPRWLRFAGGVLQVQSIYVTASGSGITRMLGVTVFVNGRAGIGRTIARAVRQAVSPP